MFPETFVRGQAGWTASMESKTAATARAELFRAVTAGVEPVRVATSGVADDVADLSAGQLARLDAGHRSGPPLVAVVGVVGVRQSERAEDEVSLVVVGCPPLHDLPLRLAFSQDASGVVRFKVQAAGSQTVA